jgi:hypothetical protein
MPNHVSNRLTLQCSKDTAAKVLAAISGKEDGTPRLIDFNTLIPYPEHFAKLDREAEQWRKAHAENPLGGPKDGFNQGGYEWRCKHWGTKWNAYSQKKLSATAIYFETAWAAPEPVMDALATRFPDIPFTLEYADEGIGNNAGIIRYANGKKDHAQREDAEAARLVDEVERLYEEEDEKDFTARDAAASRDAESSRNTPTIMDAKPRTVTLTHFGRQVTVSVHAERYHHGGGLAVQLMEDGEDYATLSVNVAGVPLKDDEFVAKTYSENEGLLEGLLAAGVVERTGRWAEIGPICRLLPG